jgi:hypothetical protein
MIGKRGRPKGSASKITLSIKEKSEQLGCDPFEILLHFAKGDWKALGYESDHILKPGGGGEVFPVPMISAEMRLKAASDACQYLYPKRKAIEGSLNVTDPTHRPLAHLTDEELDQL